jgi:hypothetical protein
MTFDVAPVVYLVELTVCNAAGWSASSKHADGRGTVLLVFVPMIEPRASLSLTGAACAALSAAATLSPIPSRRSVSILP